MSALTDTLDKKTILKWREFCGTAEFQRGIDYLRHNHAPKSSNAETDVQLVRAAVGWGSYMQALSDIEDKLTFIPEAEKAIEEPGLSR